MEKPTLKETMTQHDEELIAKALDMPYIRWYEVDEDAADSKPGWEMLHSIASSLYHREEASIGDL